MKSIAIIPARMSSGRFPSKPLKEIEGMSTVDTPEDLERFSAKIKADPLWGQGA